MLWDTLYITRNFCLPYHLSDYSFGTLGCIKIATPYILQRTFNHPSIPTLKTYPLLVLKTAGGIEMKHYILPLSVSLNTLTTSRIL